MDQERRMALFVEKDTSGGCVTRLREIDEEQLPPGEVTIRVAYSGMNYKDRLAARADGRIVASYPFVPGIDLSGTVERSSDSRFRPKDEVLVTGYGLGVSHFGGYSEIARVPGDWVVPLPVGLDLREAMAIGTAGFTAALSIARLQECGLQPGNGPVAVSAATGGVGSLAVALLSGLGYEVVAGTGQAEHASMLLELGASVVVSREELAGDADKPMQRERWAAAVDSVGGRTLAGLLSAVRYGGAVAASGLAESAQLPATVFPFILRGVRLLGIDSVYTPYAERLRIWQLLADEWRPRCGYPALIAEEIDLNRLGEALQKPTRTSPGRVLVRVGGQPIASKRVRTKGNRSNPD